MFEQLPDICVEHSEHEAVSSADVSNINATIMKEKNSDNKEVKLSLSTKELMNKTNTL